MGSGSDELQPAVQLMREGTDGAHLPGQVFPIRTSFNWLQFGQPIAGDPSPYDLDQDACKSRIDIMQATLRHNKHSLQEDMYYIDSMKIIVLQLNSKNSQEEFIQQNFPDIFVL